MEKKIEKISDFIGQTQEILGFSESLRKYLLLSLLPDGLVQSIRYIDSKAKTLDDRQTEYFLQFILYRCHTKIKKFYMTNLSLQDNFWFMFTLISTLTAPRDGARWENWLPPTHRGSLITGHGESLRCWL